MNYLQALRQFRRGHIPGQLVIQITDRCNAKCPQCGMRVTRRYPRSELGLEDTKRILDAAAQRGVKAVSFTGGEPMLVFDDLVRMIDYADAAGIRYIRTGTNGYLFCGADRPGFRSRIARIADRLAATALRNFWISLDSAVPAVHEQMRGFPGLIRGVEKALPIFQERGIYPSANLGINRKVGGRPILRSELEDADSDSRRRYLLNRYREAFRRFYGFVENLGFSIVNACYPMSMNGRAQTGGLQAVYAAESKEDIVSFSQTEKTILFRALMDVIPEYRSRLRIFSPLCSLLALVRQYEGRADACVYSCRGGVDFFSSMPATAPPIRAASAGKKIWAGIRRQTWMSPKRLKPAGAATGNAFAILPSCWGPFWSFSKNPPPWSANCSKTRSCVDAGWQI